MTTSGPTPEERAAQLERHLHEHGYLDAEDLDARLARLEHATAAGTGPSPALGARVVARAWTDRSFRAWLLADAVSAVAEYAPQSVPLRVLENTPTVHNVIVCTLCSCYPGALLGNPPGWYKSFEYRSRVVREPRTVLAEFGTHVPDGIQLRVHDSTSEQRYLVLPRQPLGTRYWAQDQLATLVTRNSMIGTGHPLTPT